MSPINAQCDSKRASPTSSPLPLSICSPPTCTSTWLNLGRDVTSCCYCQVMQAGAHRLHFAYRWPGWPAWHTHSWHWPRSTVTVTTYPAYATGAAESCSKTFAAAPSSLSLSSSVSVSLWIMSIALAQWSSVQLLAHHQPEKRETKQISGAEGKERRED